ncbi:MAG: rRNA pseudouridine synthase [Corynebacteriales bacterium]|nr:rRNA pseudouridine synthase [Mycobacteriales bacterium]
MSSPETNETNPGQRLQKVLASAGVGSRRSCEDLIFHGRVSVNGQVVDRMGMRVDPAVDVIHVDGARIIFDDSLVYLALNKPRGVVSTMNDDRGRTALASFVTDIDARVFHVGRLDYDSEGLLLLMNDGELAHRLAHPSFEITKKYVCEVPGPVWPRIGKQLLEGVELEDGIAKADQFRTIEQFGERAMVEITLHSGKNRIVRRMLAAVGYPVKRLIRKEVGPIKLERLKPGAVRRLTMEEVGQLYKAVGL